MQKYTRAINITNYTQLSYMPRQYVYLEKLKATGTYWVVLLNLVRKLFKMCVFSIAGSRQVTGWTNNYNHFNKMYLRLFPLKKCSAIMVSNRHVYQLVATVTSVLNCGLCSLWAAIKENTEGREQGDEGSVILERTLKYQYLTLYDWIWLSVSAHVW